MLQLHQNSLSRVGQTSFVCSYSVHVLTLRGQKQRRLLPSQVNIIRLADARYATEQIIYRLVYNFFKIYTFLFISMNSWFRTNFKKKLRHLQVLFVEIQYGDQAFKELRYRFYVIIKEIKSVPICDACRLYTRT